MSSSLNNQNTKLTLAWFMLSVVVVIFAYFFFYPPIYAFRDEQSYLGLSYLFRQGKLLVEPSSFPISAYADLGGRGVPIYPIGNALLLIPFTLFTWKGAFLLGIVSHLVATYFFYRLTKLWSQDNLFAVLLYFLFPPFLFFSRTLMSDMPSLMFFMMAYYFYFKSGSKKWLAGVLFGINIFFRVSNVLIILPFGITLLWRAMKKKEIEALVSFAVAVVPFGLLAGLYQMHAFGSPFLTGYSRAITGVKNLGFEYWAYQIPHYLLNLTAMYPLMLPFIFLSKKIRKIEILLSMIGLTFFYSLYYFHDQFPQKSATILFGNRFLFPVMPFFLLGYSEVLKNILDKFSVFFRNIIISVMTLGLLGTCLFLNVQHQGILKKQLKLKEQIYSVTTEGSALVFDRNSAELVQGVWGDRYYFAYQDDPDDVLELMKEVDKSKDVFMVKRDVVHPAAFIGGVREESIDFIRKRFVVEEIVQEDKMKIYQIKDKV